PDIYEAEEDALVVINTNYVIEAGLDPQTDTLFKEEDDSPYVNVVAVDEEDEDNEAVNTLVVVLHSDEMVDFIVEEYDGEVVPVSEVDKRQFSWWGDWRLFFLLHNNYY